MKTKKILLITAMTMLTLPGAFAISESEEPITSEPSFGGLSLGKFQKIQVLNKLKDSSVKIFLNEFAKNAADRFEIELKEKPTETLSIPVQGGVRINDWRFIVENLKKSLNEPSIIDSGIIVLDWQKKNALERLKSELRRKGINISIDQRGGTLVITIG